MKFKYIKSVILTVFGIVIGVLFFICIIRLGDEANCKDYKLFLTKGVKVKGIVEQFSGSRSLHYVTFKFELDGVIYSSKDQFLQNDFKIGDSVCIYVIPESPGKVLSEYNFQYYGCNE